MAVTPSFYHDAAPTLWQSRASAYSCLRTSFMSFQRSFMDNPGFSEEVFGPSSMFIGCSHFSEMKSLAGNLPGQLTATVHADKNDFKEFKALMSILKNKAGRILSNGFPTGVEVCASMHHGGPYPAATDVRSTSVGTAALLRFARPVCYQNCPDELLPPELQNANPGNLWRLVDGRYTRDKIS